MIDFKQFQIGCPGSNQELVNLTNLFLECTNLDVILSSTAVGLELNQWSPVIFILARFRAVLTPFRIYLVQLELILHTWKSDVLFWDNEWKSRYGFNQPLCSSSDEILAELF